MNGVSIYPELNNKEWLYQKYIQEGLGTTSIAKLIGVKQPNSVRQALIRFEIPMRNFSDGQTYLRCEDNFRLNPSVIDGCLLGDGMLTVYNRESNCSYPYFKKRNKYFDHIQYVAGKLGIVDRVKTYEEVFRNKKYDIHSIKSLSHKELLPLYKKWYPESNDYKKIVPIDLVLTPETLLHWFMDDGCSQIRVSNGKPFIILCSESFTRAENEFLIAQLGTFGIESSITPVKSGSGWRIRIPQHSTPLFYEIIGSCPVPSLAYKWKKSVDIFGTMIV